MRSIAPIIGLVIWQLGAVPSGAEKSGLTRLLEAELTKFPARAGLHVKHLASGEEATVRGDERFNSASVIKIPVMVLAFQLADQKTLDLNERVELRKADFRGGSGVLRAHDPGLAPTVRDLITQMIITSDNTATDLMIARVGGIDRVNEWLRRSGYHGLELLHTTFEVFRKRYEVLDPAYKTLGPEDVFALQTEQPAFTAGRETLLEKVREESRTRSFTDEYNRRAETDANYWLGAMTPRDTGRMLEGIERGTIASRESCDAMKRIMRQQQSGARRIPHFLTVPVAHKTGDIPPVVANDVGMIYARSGPIVLAIFARNIRGLYADTEDRIGRVSRLIVEFFDGSDEPIR